MIEVTTNGYNPQKVTLKKGKQGGTIAVSTSPPPANRKPSKYLHPDDLPVAPIEVTVDELIEHDKAMSKSPQPRFLDLMR